MELSELQKRVDAWIREYGVRYFSELTNMAILTEEVGELARVMARKYGDQSFKAGEKENLADESTVFLFTLGRKPLFLLCQFKRGTPLDLNAMV